MNEKPLERLNYYNGQRLEASDLKTEQEYHIRTRRWLNKSLYSAGIARGLEVRAITEGPKKDTPYVSVSPGLALDNDGREIILLEEETVEVCSFAGTDESTVVGNYLVIEYAEDTIAYEKGGCAVRTEGKGASKSTAPMGGPSRIQSTVKFSWVPFVPHPGSNQIVLARVELTAPNCDSVHQIDAGARRYIGAASAATVRQYALEGERHIDKDNPGRIYFHIRGRQPNSVTLYLRAEKFSTLYYTELGQHNHFNPATGFSVTVPRHNHTITPNVTGADGGHTPSYRDIRAQTNNIIVDKVHGFSWTLWDPPVNVDQSVRVWANFRILFNPVLDHVHTIPGSTGFEPENRIGLSGSGTSGNAGVSDVQGRVDAPAKREHANTFVNDLQVLIGESVPRLQNKTGVILDQLRDAQQGVTWDKLGNGLDSHALAIKGTDAIRLDFLPDISFAEGNEYLIELRVASGGGRILYNLYIE